MFTAQGTGATWSQRPTLTRYTAGNALHGTLLSPFYVEMTDTSGANSIKDVVLVGLSTVTHGFNTGQRRIALERSDWSMGVDSNKNHVRIDRFPAKDLTPPGYYMLFLINHSGVPSRGVIVAVGAGTAAPQPA
ncbi:galactose oxidase early set domain-containing protein [Ideonella paludis]|uniref:galactose oxidase early set domain-containing protein n=1 Tax=Ideonella paludis TaxID=1233411 RepID=UPI00362701D6